RSDPYHADEALEEGGLARAVRPDQRDDLAGLGADRYVPDDRVAAVARGHPRRPQRQAATTRQGRPPPRRCGALARTWSPGPGRCPRPWPPPGRRTRP